jgi:hypothetical protein
VENTDTLCKQNNYNNNDNTWQNADINVKSRRYYTYYWASKNLESVYEDSHGSMNFLHGFVSYPCQRAQVTVGTWAYITTLYGPLDVK